MAPARLLDRPIQLRHDDDSDDEDGDSSDNSDRPSPAEAGGLRTEDPTSESSANGHDRGSSDVDASEYSNDEDGDEEDINLADISFGALARAQETLAPPTSRLRKRKRSDLEGEDTTKQEEQTKPIKEAKHPDSKPNQPLHRTSKHAPTVLSSKHPVSRKRQILEPSVTEKSRDPRFDAAIKSHTLHAKADEHADRNYAFLTTYQANEVLELKSQIKKSKDPELTAELRRQIMSLEARIRNVEGKQKERDIIRRHKDQEKQAIREGKKSKPFFLKQSDVRKQIQQEKLDNMGKRARDKMDKRKLKKQKGKEGREMPRFRRGAES